MADFVPWYNSDGKRGNVVRIDLANFSASGVTSLNLASTNANLKGFRACFRAGFTDGTHAYFVPIYSGGAGLDVVRVLIQPHTPGTASSP